MEDDLEKEDAMGWLQDDEMTRQWEEVNKEK